LAIQSTITLVIYFLMPSITKLKKYLHIERRYPYKHLLKQVLKKTTYFKVLRGEM